MNLPTIWVMEDEDQNYNSLATCLQDEFCVCRQPSGEPASGAEDTDLVIIGIGKDSAAALEICSKFSDHEVYPHLPVLMTGEADHRSAAYAAGASGFLVFPVEPVELQVRVRSEIERKQFKDQSTGFQKRLDASLQMMVHDLKNVLTVVETNLELMELKQFKDCDQSIHMSRHNCRVMFYLIQDVSEIHKLQNGSLKLDLKTVDVGPLIQKCADNFVESVSYRKGSVKVDTGHTAPLLADKEMVYHVLFNLMSNASRNTRRDGTVTIRGFTQDGMVGVEVTDEGDTVPDAHRGQMFDQTRFSDSGFQTGKGLGLTFCRLAVQAHGGTIRYEAEGKTGNRISVMLPVDSGS